MFNGQRKEKSVLEGRQDMKTVYILYEERESSQLCNIKGVWNTKELAVEQMRKEINNNSLYSDYSMIDFEKGFSQSDPNYCDEMYSDYSIKRFDM